MSCFKKIANKEREKRKKGTITIYVAYYTKHDLYKRQDAFQSFISQPITREDRLRAVKRGSECFIQDLILLLNRKED